MLVNGSPSAPFNPSRGIRQGDPLSPFLLILTTEGLGRSLLQVVVGNKLKGISLNRGMDPLLHLQFVDDTMLLGSTKTKEAKTIITSGH